MLGLRPFFSDLSKSFGAFLISLHNRLVLQLNLLTTGFDIIAEITSNLRTLISKNELLVEQKSKLEHSAVG